MKKRWKSLAAVFGSVVLVLGQNEIASVKAEGLPVLDESPQQQEAVEERGTTSPAGAQSRAAQLLPANSLSWNELGQGIFYNPNNGVVGIMAYVYGPGGEKSSYWGLHRQGEITLDLYHLLDETGTYTFAIEILTNSGSVLSGISSGFEYTAPEIQLPKPVVNVSREGLVSCALPENSNGQEYTLGTDYGFNYELYSLNTSGEYTQVRQQGKNEYTHDFSADMVSGNIYYVRVRTLSRDVTRYVDSEWSDYIPVNPDAADSTHEQAPQQVEERWEPTTPDEIKRYAAYNMEEVHFSADEKNAYDITVQNSLQGEKCFDSFEAVLGDYVIGRTYNIFPSGEPVYRMDSKARITLNIPETLQSDNRTFRMICVTENGLPVVLEDLDSNSKTITFETDTYYAFALAYKDTVASKSKSK